MRPPVALGGCFVANPTRRAPRRQSDRAVGTGWSFESARPRATRARRDMVPGAPPYPTLGEWLTWPRTTSVRAGPRRTSSIRSLPCLTRLGVSVYGSRVLEVKGRKSGEWRRTPVNLLRYDGARISGRARGQTQWVKNLRASGQGRLRVGRRTQSFHAVELADAEKPPPLRAYLKKWKAEVGVFSPVLDSTLQTRNCATSHSIIRYAG
jgi:deazaflavin-dependent oxidoreductase (nitroreductase family)